MGGGVRLKRKLSVHKAEKESGTESEYNIPAEAAEVFFDHMTCLSGLNFSGDEGDEKDKRDDQVKLDLT